MILPPIVFVIGLWTMIPILIGLGGGFLIGDVVVLLMIGIEKGWTFPIRCKCDKK